MCISPKEALELYGPAKAERLRVGLKSVNAAIKITHEGDDNHTTRWSCKKYQDVVSEIAMSLKKVGWYVKSTSYQGNYGLVNSLTISHTPLKASWLDRLFGIYQKVY